MRSTAKATNRVTVLAFANLPQKKNLVQFAAELSDGEEAEAAGRPQKRLNDPA